MAQSILSALPSVKREVDALNCSDHLGELLLRTISANCEAVLDNLDKDFHAMNLRNIKDIYSGELSLFEGQARHHVPTGDPHEHDGKE